MTTTIKMDRRARAYLDPLSVSVWHLDGMDTAVTCADGSRHIVNTDRVAEALKGGLENSFKYVIGDGWKLLSYNFHTGVTTVEAQP